MTATVTAPLDLNAQAPATFTPNGDRYLVEEVEVSKMSAGGILMPFDNDEATRGWIAGRIVAVGNGHRLERDVTVPMAYGSGDVVMIDRLAGRKVILQGRPYRVVNQTDVLGRFGVKE